MPEKRDWTPQYRAEILAQLSEIRKTITDVDSYLINVAQAAALIDSTPKTLRTKLSRGTCPFKSIRPFGHFVRFSLGDVLRHIGSL